MSCGEENKRDCEGEALNMHVMIFPLPAQGHVNAMLQLAELLAVSGVHVSFVNTEHIHARLIRSGDAEARFARYPTLHLKTIPDGLPPDDPRHSDDFPKIFHSLNSEAKPWLTHLCNLQQQQQEEASGIPRLTCIIADGIFGSLTNELGHDLGIPVIHFRTASASSFRAYFCGPNMFHHNQLPIRGEQDMDRIITNIPGMENFIRCRDLPSFYRKNHKGQIGQEQVIFETHESLRAQALILNTFEDLEGPVLSQIRLHFPKLYTLGPLHAHLNSRRSNAFKTEPPASLTTSLWKADTSCMTWLDAQPPKSVLYVSFGSVTTMPRDNLMEIWHGLANSRTRFLWVIRPDMVAQQDAKELPTELEEATKERGYMVEWAPQKEVLAHVAVGGFMTHSGWNSTLESVVAGVPMICWPYFADQQINSRFVSEVWKVGLDMKDVCDRKVVERMVKDVMVERKQEFLRTTQAMAELARASVGEGGSSYSDFDALLQRLKSMAHAHAT